MSPGRWADDGEQDMDRLAIHRPEIDWLGQESECDGRPHDLQDNRVPYMRDGNAVANSGRSRCLPREEEAHPEFPLYTLGQRQDLNQRARCSFLAAVLELVMNAADFQRLRQSGDTFCIG